MASQMCALGQTGSALRCERAFKQGPSARCTQRFSRRHLVCRAAQDVMCPVTKHGFGFMKGHPVYLYPQPPPIKIFSQEPNFVQQAAQRLAAAGATAALLLSPCDALANEFDILNEPRPTTNYVIDDAGVLNKTTRKSINDQLSRLETETGYRLEAVTTRKLEFENDAFAFGDKVVEKWYGTVEQGTNKGILVVVTTGKDGALTGGPDFMKAVGDSLVDSVVSDNIPIFTEEEKFNEAVSSIVKRVEAKLMGKPDPGAPQRADKERKRTYKTKDEVNKTRGLTSTIVLVLLFISVAVPMLQYWGYTSKE